MNTAILLSGGEGKRLGADIPKQYIEVEGHSIIYYTMKNILASKCIDRLMVVAAPQWQNYILEVYEEIKRENFIKQTKISFATPGRNRQESILNGLTICACEYADTEFVMVHDAVRPFLESEMIDDYFSHMRSSHCNKGVDGLLPVLPMKDTVYYCENQKEISGLLDRSKIFAGQAPEMFDFHKYYDANLALSDDELMRINGSTEPAIMAGMNIKTIPGCEQNFKITTIEDLKRFEAIIKGEAD